MSVFKCLGYIFFLTPGLVQQHQAEMERMDSFRDRFGANWLQYRWHLETEGQAGNHSPSRSPTTDSLGSSGVVSEQSKNMVQEQKELVAEEEKQLEMPQGEAVVEVLRAEVETIGLTAKEDKDLEEKVEGK